jgi:glycosyltransferase involved in cell wall biosynthesis
MQSCDILLATFNGEKFIGELLDSLLAQTFTNYTLIVRDDGSNDATVKILHDYMQKFGGRMKIVDEGGQPTGSAEGNFSVISQYSRADYILFADQDDVWFPNKVEGTLELLKNAENGAPGTPIYVFTDVVPASADLKPLAESFWQFKKIDPAISQSLSQSLVCGAELGCASGINRVLLTKLFPTPKGVCGHDWWGLLIANVFGVVKYSPERTLLYRLHGANQSNHQKVSTLSYLRQLDRILDVPRGMRRRREQAAELLNRFGDTIPLQKRRTIERDVESGSRGFVRRRWDALRGNYLYPDIQRNVAMILGM